MEQRGRGRGQARGRGRGTRGARGGDPTASKATTPSALTRVREAGKRAAIEAAQSTNPAMSSKRARAEAAAEERHALKVDENGRIVADVTPPRKFPSIADCGLIQGYTKDIEEGAVIGKTIQATMSAGPRHLVDQMKVSPVEKWKGVDSVYKEAWKTSPSARSSTEPEGLKTFFQEVINAFEADKVSLENTLGAALDSVFIKPPKEKSESSKHLLKDVKKAAHNNKPPPPYWEMKDPDEELYTDSEEDEDGRLSTRFAPPVAALRRVRRQLIRTEQQQFLIGRSLAILTEGGDEKRIRQDNAESVQTRLYTTKQQKHRAARAEWREWVAAGRAAEWRLHWRSTNDLFRFQLKDDVLTIPNKSQSFCSLYLSLLAKRFPNRVRSTELKQTPLTGDPYKDLTPPNPLKWLIDDEVLLSDEQIRRFELAKPIQLKMDEGNRLYLANITQMMGRPMGRQYNLLRLGQDFHYWLMSVGSGGLQPLRLLKRLRPDSRSLRALITKRLHNHTGTSSEANETLISAIGTMSGAAAVGSTYSQAATAVEAEDSDAGRSEDEQMTEQANTLKQIVVKPESTNFGSAAYGPENVVVRLGGGFGRLRNTFDVNRGRRMGLELLKTNTQTPVPIDYDSSEDEDRMYISRHNVYRHRFKKFRVRLVRSEADKTKAEEEATAVSEWPGSSLDQLLLKRRAESEAANAAAVAVGSSSKKRRKKTTVNSTAANEAAIDNFNQSMKIAEDLGLREETWKGFNLKPRVRAAEWRMDRDPEAKVPLGFVAQGESIAGRETQLVGIDLAEFGRRFGLSRLFQDSMPRADALMAHRRHFAVIIDETVGSARIVKASPTQLIFGDAPEESMRDYMWNFYWSRARAGGADHHMIKKAVRYRNIVDNNAAVWKEDLERYQKLREKANEHQSHREIRYLKARPAPYRMKTALNALATPDFHYEYTDAAKGDVDAISESDLSGVEFEDVIARSDEDESTAAESGSAPASKIGLSVDKEKRPLTVGIEEAKVQARNARKVAEDRERYSGVTRVKAHLMVNWNCTRTQLRRRITARHRELLQETYFSSNRQYRAAYKKIRSDIADRVLYENAWVGAAVKRASAPQRESTAVKTEAEDEV